MGSTDEKQKDETAAEKRYTYTVEMDNNLYKKLRSEGYSESQIEEVYKKLKEKGYGGSRRSIPAGALIRDYPAVRFERRRYAVRRGLAEAAADAAEEEPVRAKRAIDWVAPIPVKLRRRINRYAYFNKYLITGFAEYFGNLLTLFNPFKKDFVNDRLIRRLVVRKGWTEYSPYDYTLIDNLDALYFCARSFIGIRGGEGDLKDQRNRTILTAVQSSFRNRDPFALQFFRHFADYRQLLRNSLSFIHQYYRSGMRVECELLARTVKETYALILRCEAVEPWKLQDMMELAVDINIAHDRNPAFAQRIREEAKLFPLAFKNLAVFKRELYPALLKMIGVFYPFEDDSVEKRGLIFAFAELNEDDILSYTVYKARELERKEEERIHDIQGEVEKLELEKEEQLSEKFEGILAVLEELFPKSGIERIHEMPFLLPYFDRFIFEQNLSFDHNVRNIEFVNMKDPMGTIMVFHRIIDELLSCLNEFNIGTFLEEKDIPEQLSDIKTEWKDVYSGIFNPFLKELSTFAAEITADEAYAEKFRRGRLAQVITEELDRIRAASVRHYSGSSVREQTKRYLKLYVLADELNSLLLGLREHMGRDLTEEKGLFQRHQCERLREHPVAELYDESKTSGTYRRNVAGQVYAYIDSRYGGPAGVPECAVQVYFVEIMSGICDLYSSLLNEEQSIFTLSPRGIIAAGEAEKAAWAESAKSRETRSLETLRRELLEEKRSTEYLDRLTGLKNRNYFEKEAPAIFSGRKKKNMALTIVLIDIDHFKWINDEFGHQTGDFMLQSTAEMIRSAVRDGDIAVRYGGEEILIIIAGTLHVGIITGERLRYLQERSLQTKPEYRDVAAIRERRGEPCGTLSVGIAAAENAQSLSECTALADSALYHSKKSRNTLSYHFHDGKKSSEPRILTYEDFKKSIRLSH